jgi:tetratricopeptide (TPR) repeat protein
MINCMDYGESITEEDKAALREAHAQQIPNVPLLKSRILSDGGYGTRALEEINKINLSELSEDDSIEYSYRKARILQNLGNAQAISLFEDCISLGQDKELYFACNSALQLGMIHEKNGLIRESETYYKKCLEMNPSEYKNGLHQKAKAGLKRIKDIGE